MHLNIQNLEELDRYISTHDSVRYLSFKFSDCYGALKEFCMPARSFIDNFVNCEKIKIDQKTYIIPDWSSSFLEPFTSNAVLSVFCSLSGSICVRSIAKRALTSINSIVSAIEAKVEFYIFDDARYSSAINSGLCEINSEEGDYNFKKQYEYGNIAHRMGGDLSFVSQPIDTLSEIRIEIANVLEKIGINVVFHAHSKGHGQCFFILDLAKNSDTLQIFKYVVKNVVASFGKSSTFMTNISSYSNPSFVEYYFYLKEGFVDYEKLAKDFFNGLINNMPAILGLTNSSLNSYRFKSLHNALCAFEKKGGELSQSIFGKNCFSVGFSDASSDLYIALSAIISAMMDDAKSYSSVKQKFYQVNELSFINSLLELKERNLFLLRDGIFDKKSLEDLVFAYEELASKKESLPITDFESSYSC